MSSMVYSKDRARSSTLHTLGVLPFRTELLAFSLAKPLPVQALIAALAGLTYSRKVTTLPHALSQCHQENEIGR